jgi:flagellin
MILQAGSSSFDVWAQTSVNNAFARLARVGEKLATLNRINRASDDPAGLISAQGLSHELASINRATESLDRTRAMVRVADSGLAHSSALLIEMQGNVVAAANDSLMPEQREALQYELDAGIDALNRLGQTTFAGQQVFDQSRNFLVGTEPHDQVSLDLIAVDESLGGNSGVLSALRSGGTANLQGGDLELASRILGEAQSQVLSARAELGAFERYSVDTTLRRLEETSVQSARGLSAIQDTDVAAESSNLVREMILADTAVATAKLALRVRGNLLALTENAFDLFG